MIAPQIVLFFISFVVYSIAFMVGRALYNFCTQANPEYRSGKFRVRRSLFGNCVLQEWQEYPNHHMREWKDVRWKFAPMTLNDNRRDGLPWIEQ